MNPKQQINPYALFIIIRVAESGKKIHSDAVKNNDYHTRFILPAAHDFRNGRNAGIVFSAENNKITPSQINKQCWQKPRY